MWSNALHGASEAGRGGQLYVSVSCGGQSRVQQPYRFSNMRTTTCSIRLSTAIDAAAPSTSTDANNAKARILSAQQTRKKVGRGTSGETVRRGTVRVLKNGKK